MKNFCFGGMRKLIVENFAWMPSSSGLYESSPVSDTVKLFGSRTTLSVCVLSLMYSIFPLAVFPGPLTTFSSISGWTVCAKTGVAEENKNRRHTARKARLPGRCPNVNETVTLASIQLRCGLRLDVERADVSIRRQLRNHCGVNLIGQRVRPA